MSAMTFEPTPPPRPRRELELLETIAGRLERLEARLDALAPLADAASHLGQLPAMVATMTDTIDEQIRDLQDRGIDVDERLRGLLALTEQLTRPETVRAIGRLLEVVPRLDVLIESPLLEPETLAVLGKLSAALATTRAEAAGEAGLFRAWRATRKPEVRRALDFALRLTHHFGASLAAPTAIAPPPAPAELPAPRRGDPS